jgi:hypothetical protein
MDEPDAQTYLEQLAAELAEREWIARLERRDKNPALKVVNPGAGALSEVVVCRLYGEGWAYCWPWDQTIGAVSNVPAAADRIQHVLRRVDR